MSMDDVPVLHALVERINIAELGHPDTTEAELRDDLGGPHFELSNDTCIAIDPAGRAVAYGQGHDEHTGTGWIDVYIDPEQQDFDRVADAVIAACAARIIESVVQREVPSVKLTANLYETENRMREAYERAHFHVATIYWRMALAFEDAGELEEPRLPNGFQIRSVDPGDDAVMAQGFDLYRDTFSEHHGSQDSEVTLDDYAENWRGAESFDRTAWWFAYEGDEPVGMLLGDNRRVEQGDGYVRNIGVRKSLRGRGIARALMLTAFAHWRSHGRTGVQLGVDTANVTGATRLYESVGMRSLLSALALERSVTL